MRKFLLVLLVLTLFAAAGCTGTPLSTREKGTGVGALLGAGSGALIGAAVGHPLAGASIGGVMGAGTGMLIGNELQNNEIRNAYTQRQVNSQQRQLEYQRREIQQMQQSREVE